MNPLRDLHGQGQAIRLDAISRQLIDGGKLARLIEKDRLHGVTSNPTIFDQAISRGADYDPALRGRIANAKLAYLRFREIFHGDAFTALRSRGARVQRPLWGSTGTRNKAYSDVLCVEELIGPETVNTVPMVTLDAFRDHGRVRASLLKATEQAREDIARLAALGIDLAAITEKLQEDGGLPSPRPSTTCSPRCAPSARSCAPVAKSESLRLRRNPWNSA